jgi:argininosuccinate lyase
VLASRALTQAQSVLGSLHNTPFADMNDAEDPLQPMVALAFSDAQRALALLAGALSEATFAIEHMRARAGSAFLPVTEVADTLVRVGGISFREAHEIVSAAVRSATSDDPEPLASDLERRATEAGLRIERKVLRDALDPEHFVAVRKREGGPAKEALLPEIERAQGQLSGDQAWLAGERAHMAEAHRRLHREAAGIAG